MATRRIWVPLLTAWLLAAGAAASAPPERPSVRVRVTPANKEALREIRTGDLDVLHAAPGDLQLLVTPDQEAALRARGNVVEVLDPDVYAAASERGGGFLPEYVSTAESAARLQELAQAHPSLTDLLTIGSSVEGRPLLALKISDRADVDEDEPEVLVMGAHHAREVITPIVVHALADSLLGLYGEDSRFTRWVDEREIWIVPVVNPDGLVHVETADLWWRKNRRDNGPSCARSGERGVDLNRNYPLAWGHDDIGSGPDCGDDTFRGSAPGSEPEVAAIMALVSARRFVFSLSFHAFGNQLLWGPGYKPALSEDEDILSAFGAMVSAANGYTPGNPASGAIYVTNGDSEDWLLLSPTHPRVLALTPEVGASADGFHPDASRIPALVAQGLEACWVALEHADRPGRLAAPGPAIVHPVPESESGAYSLAWSGPTAGDTHVAAWALTEKAGPVVGADDLERGDRAFSPGGWSLSATRAASGSFSLHSGSGNALNRILFFRESHEVQPEDAFTYSAWYDIEDGWDYAYAILSTDGGRTFTNLPGTGTTMQDPQGNNADHGITGRSDGWRTHRHELSAWAGTRVWLGLRYSTDGATAPEGIYVDDLRPVVSWGKTEILSTDIAGASHHLAGRSDGARWYSVRGRDAEGNWGYPSPERKIVVNLSAQFLVSGSDGVFLGSPRPNPFRSETALRFALARAGGHRLSVHDARGRQVRVLSEGPLAAGAHRVEWNGTDARGRPLPAGVYYLKLASAAGDRTRRAVVVR